MPLAILTLVGETMRCECCLRVLPVERLKPLPSFLGPRAVCADTDDCVGEMDRQERARWRAHRRVA